jgi:hypothetical protein
VLQGERLEPVGDERIRGHDYEYARSTGTAVAHLSALR